MNYTDEEFNRMVARFKSASFRMYDIGIDRYRDLTEGEVRIFMKMMLAPAPIVGQIERCVWTGTEWRSIA